MSDTLLEVENVTVRFGGIVALDRISFVVARSHIVGFIGPNGAGKTTFFNCLTGLYPCSGGRNRVEGSPMPGTPRRPFGPLLTAMVTPRRDDGYVDLSA